MKTKYLNTTSVGAMAILILCGLASTALAGDEAAEVQSSGILPLPDYSGDFLERAYLLGDLGGQRSQWAEKGFIFNLDYNQYFQSVESGGLDNRSEYGGTIDYNFSIDFDRMGTIPGGLLQMRAVSRYGNTVNGISGSIIPVNTDAGRPPTANLNEDIGLWLPVINYTQFLSEKFAVGFGKFDTYDSSNEFAGGRGKSQWWNQNLTMPVSPALITPYSILGATAVVIPSPNLMITGLIGTSTDTSDRSGFDDLDDALFGLLSINYQYEICDLPGGIGIMPGYGWNGSFNQINGRINLSAGQLVPTKKDDTWFASTDFWQYLWVEGSPAQAVNAADGRQDLQGVGAFSRIQFADNDTNPLDYSISSGLNAKGLLPGRDDDAMGVAYYHNQLVDSRFGRAVGIGDSSSGWEFFYNVELTPAAHLTLDAQSIEGVLPNVGTGVLPNVGTGVIFGTSLQIQF